MCDLELDYAVMSEALGLDFEKHFAGELASFDDLELRMEWWSVNPETGGD